MPCWVLGFSMIFLLMMWFAGTLMLFGPKPYGQSECESLFDKMIGGRLAVISGLLFWICSTWMMAACYNWPYQDTEKEVFIYRNVAYIAKADLGILSDDNMVSDDMLEENYINLNSMMNRQFQSGDKVTLRTYSDSYGWLTGGADDYKVNGVLHLED